MAKQPTLTDVSSGFRSNTTINNNNDAIEAAFDNTVSRDGSTPNHMLADFDMNDNDILNVNRLYADAMTLAGTAVTITDLVADPVAVVIHDTKESVGNTTLPADKNIVLIGGYSALGDGGHGMYTRVAVEPSHEGKIETANNIWLELVFDGSVRAAQFGSGVSSVNNAIAFVNAKGGGKVFVTSDLSFASSIDVLDNVTLVVPAGVTLTLTASVTSAIDFGTDRTRPGLHLEGTLALGGNATYGIEADGAQYPYIGGWGEITGWKGGVFLHSSPTLALRWPRIRGLILGVPHTSNVIYPFRVSCQPDLGCDMVDGVDIDGLFIEDATPGAYSAVNAQTADQVSCQGVIGGWITNVRSVNGGENGMTLEFGSRGIDVSHTYISNCDGHGLTAAGAHYRIDVVSNVGTFVVGETITGGTSGATGEIQFLPTQNIIWIMNVSSAKFVAGETITGGTSGATATVSIVYNGRNFRIHDTVRTTGNGNDVGATGATLAGVYIHHTEDSFVGGHHTDNDDTGILISESTYGFFSPHVAIDATQINAITVTGGATAVTPTSIEGNGDATVFRIDDNDRLRFGENLQANPATLSTAAATNNGITINTQWVLEACANAAPTILTNRTGSVTTKLGPTVDVRKDGVSVAYIGTAGHKFPEFTLATMPAAASHTSAMIVVTDASGGPTLCKSDGSNWKVMAVQGATVA